MFSIKFPFLKIFSMILSLKFLACASLKNYGKKYGKFPWIPKMMINIGLLPGVCKFIIDLIPRVLNCCTVLYLAMFSVLGLAMAKVVFSWNLYKPGYKSHDLL